MVLSSALWMYENGSVAWALEGPSQGADIHLVFIVLAITFGVLGTLWFLKSRLSTETPNYEYFRVGLNCCTYAACAITMHMLNKSLAVTLKEPSLISISQMVVAVAFFATIQGKDLLAADKWVVLTWCIVPCFFAGMLISSFYSYEYISLSMLTITRNLMPLIVLPTEMVCMPPENKPKTNMMIWLGLATMLAGAILYGGNLDISMLGVIFSVANMAIAVCDRLLQRYLLTNNCKSLPSGVCSILNNGVAIIPSFIMASLAQEFAHAAKEGAESWLNPEVLFILLVSGFVGMGVGYYGMEAQRDISATSLFVLQNVSKVGVVLLGIFVFGDSLKSGLANLGLLMSLGGSALYGHSQMKIQEEQKNEKAKLLKEGEKATA